MSNEKQSKSTRSAWLNIYALLAIFLSILPFVVVLNEGLTKVLESTLLYRFIQQTIVPYEIRVVGAVLYLLKIPVTYQLDGLQVSGTFLRVTWNCLGWQSLIFLLVSFLIGFQGRYKISSIWETFIIGISGTFILNIVRIIIISLMGAFLPHIFAIVYHDYLAAGMTLVWLFIFWWFSYNYVLENV